MYKTNFYRSLHFALFVLDLLLVLDPVLVSEAVHCTIKPFTHESELRKLAFRVGHVINLNNLSFLKNLCCAECMLEYHNVLGYA